MYEPIVSIIVPTYNEEDDIEITLDALIKLRYINKEIIVVDDCSEDNTASIVGKYENDTSIVLIKQKINRGVSVARNVGIQKAIGEIIIILNADVILPPDFINRILPHYKNGADFVLVESEVKNIEYLFPRWVQAQHRHRYNNDGEIDWTEGFSCRRGVAISVGLFPEGIPGCSGEDAVFGENLKKFNKIKIIDRNIVVPHVVPHTFKDFWKQRLGRGKGTSYRMYFVDKTGLPVIIYHLTKYAVWTFIQIILFIPLFITAFRLAKFSSHKYKDILPFMYAGLVDKLGQRFGEWGAFFEIRNRSD